MYTEHLPHVKFYFCALKQSYNPYSWNKKELENETRKIRFRLQVLLEWQNFIILRLLFLKHWTLFHLSLCFNEPHIPYINIIQCTYFICYFPWVKILTFSKLNFFTLPKFLILQIDFFLFKIIWKLNLMNSFENNTRND